MKDLVQEGKWSPFCVNVYYLRKKHGLSKREMAQILGVGIKTLNVLEEGVLPQRLGCAVLVRASEHFGISTDQLCCRCLNCEETE